MNARIRVLLALTLATLFLLSTIPDEASAFPFRIKGYLKDGDGNPIPNGNISITGEVYDMGIQDYKETTIWLFTSNTGYYETALSYNEPGGFDAGSSVVIRYNPLNGDEGPSRTVTFTGLNAWVNLTYEKSPTLIDTILSPTGLVIIVVLISTVFIAVYMNKAAKVEEEEQENQRRVGRRRR